MAAPTGAWIRRRQVATPWHQSLSPTFFSLQTLCLIWIFSQKVHKIGKDLGFNIYDLLGGTICKPIGPPSKRQSNVFLNTFTL